MARRATCVIGVLNGEIISECKGWEKFNIFTKEAMLSFKYPEDFTIVQIEQNMDILREKMVELSKLNPDKKFAVYTSFEMSTKDSYEILLNGDQLEFHEILKSERRKGSTGIINFLEDTCREKEEICKEKDADMFIE